MSECNLTQLDMIPGWHALHSALKVPCTKQECLNYVICGVPCNRLARSKNAALLRNYHFEVGVITARRRAVDVGSILSSTHRSLDAINESLA